MTDRYLLYIDILGFSDLVQGDTSRIDDLYEVIASLNVHKHDAFKAVVFSDTILVYNTESAHSRHDRNYLVMFLCEFAQDLLHRLVERNIYFRAVLVKGEFNHYELNGIPCFFGPALVNAYNSGKEIKAIGLFIAKDVDKDNDIFSTSNFDENFNFVFVTQSLQRVERDFQGGFPADAWLFEDTEEIWHIVPEVLFVQSLHTNANSELPEPVKEKYRRSLAYYIDEYPKTFEFLLKNNFNVSEMSPRADWNTVLRRYPEGFSWAIENRNEF